MLCAVGVALLPDMRLRQISFFFLLIYLFALVYSLVLRLSLKLVKVDEPNRFWPGEWVKVRWFIKNYFVLPAPAVFVSDSVGGMEVLGRLSWNLNLGAFKTVVVEYKFRPRNRGRHLHGPLRLMTADPLGLFPFEKKLTLQREVIIYPSLRFETPSLPRPGVNGGLRAFNQFFHDMERIRGYRDYEPGDELRLVDPYLSARFFKPIVRLTEATRRRRLWVILETRQEAYPFKGRTVFWEAGINITAALLYRNWSQGQAAGIITTDLGGERSLAVPPSLNTKGYIAIFDELAVLPECEHTVIPQRALDLLAQYTRQGDVVAWVGPPPGEELEGFLEQLSKKRAEILRLILATERVRYHPDPSWKVYLMEGLG